MSQRPLIGITCGSSRLDKRAPIEQDRLNCAYSRAVLNAGGLPVIVPILADPKIALEILGRLDGLLLSGGPDIDPALYGHHQLNDSVEVDAERDAMEIPLAREAVNRDVPVLGICRGIQTLNVALGGTLLQDLPAQRPTNIQHRHTGNRKDRTHEIEEVPCSRLEASLGARRIIVNSLHHQAIDRVASDLRVTAMAPDGTVEGTEIPEARFIVAVQYHPEELIGGSAEARRLFASFVAASNVRS